jgi:hypothetical protein
MAQAPNRPSDGKPAPIIRWGDKKKPKEKPKQQKHDYPKSTKRITSVKDAVRQKEGPNVVFEDRVIYHGMPGYHYEPKKKEAKRVPVRASDY